MTVRMTLVFLAFLACCGVCHGQDTRWLNFAEDGDLKYYLDQKSVLSLPDNVYLFWVKSIAKDRDYFKKEFNLNGLSYIFTSYELDCAVARYRVRGSILFDKNRRELSKTLPGEEPLFEPVPPESMLELAQDEICARADAAAEPESEEDTKPVRPAKTRASVATSVSTLAPPAVGEVVGKVALPSGPEAITKKQVAAEPETTGPAEQTTDIAARTVKGPIAAGEPATPLVPAVPAGPVAPAEPAVPAEPAEPPTMQ